MITGFYKNYEYCINQYSVGKGELVNSWYCAYVKVDKDRFTYEEIENMEVHGGITFTGYKDFNGERVYCIGWDYNHCFDIDIKKGLFSNIWVNDKEGINKIIQEIKDFIERYLV